VRIAVLADTHDHLPPELRPVLATAGEIWHLGDICSPEILRQLRGLGPPVRVVRGNCDPPGLAAETLTLTRGGARFYLIHQPPAAVPEGTEFALHGHTHVPRDETIDGVRYLNPGTVSKPNHGAPPSFAWLGIREGRPPTWTVVVIG
jgi:putative phosphoesterase